MRAGCALAASLLLAGCVSSEVKRTPYRHSWAPLRDTETGCSSLSGDYEVLGERGALGPGALDRPHFYRVMALGVLPAGAILRLNFSERRLDVAPLDAAGVPAAPAAGVDIECRGGAAVLRRTGSHYVDGSTHHVMSETTLRLARDGALIVHVGETARTTSLLDSRTTEIDQYFRFAPAGAGAAAR